MCVDGGPGGLLPGELVRLRLWLELPAVPDAGLGDPVLAGGPELEGAGLPGFAGLVGCDGLDGFDGFDGLEGLPG